MKMSDILGYVDPFKKISCPGYGLLFFSLYIHHREKSWQKKATVSAITRNGKHFLF